MFMPKRRDRQGDQHAGRGEERDDRPAHHAADDRAPDGPATAPLAPAAQERDATLLDPVAELGEHRRQHRQRGEHRHRDDGHRADRERGEGRVAAEQHPGHRGDHGRARDEHRPARGRRCGIERRRGAAPGPPLLALASQVEERVVDADREADEDDYRGDVGVHRHQLAGQRQQADRRQHRREGDQQRHQGRDQRAEGEQEDDQGDRQRCRLGLLQVFAEDRFQRLVRAGATELLDPQPGMSALRSGGRGQGRVDLAFGGFGVAGDLELDQRRVTVSGDAPAPARGRAQTQPPRRATAIARLCPRWRPQRRARRSSVVLLWISTSSLLGSSCERSSATSARPASPGVASELVSSFCPTTPPTTTRGDDEGEPAEDGELAVRRAPAGGSGGDVLLALHGVPFGRVG